MACPECKRKVDTNEDKHICSEHGNVIGEKVPVMNMFFDDGYGNIRAVAFRDNVTKLIGKDKSYILEENNFEEVKRNLELKQIIFSGKVNRNEMFDRLEFVISSISEADPLEMVKEVDV